MQPSCEVIVQWGIDWECYLHHLNKLDLLKPEQHETSQYNWHSKYMQNLYLDTYQTIGFHEVWNQLKLPIIKEQITKYELNKSK